MTKVGKKTVLVIRSSRGEHCLRLFAHLRGGCHPDGETRWILIVQADIENFFADRLHPLDLTILAYDLGCFTRERLNQLFGERLSREKIAAAYVPFNNPAGKGYMEIIRFLSGLRPEKIMACTPAGRLERICLNRFVLRRSFAAAMKAARLILVAVSLPFVAVYYLLQGCLMKIRRRWGRTPFAPAKDAPRSEFAG